MTPVHFCFLICSERSGSNLITSLFNSHPQVCAPPPSHLFRLFANNGANYGDLDRDENWDILLQDTVMAFQSQLGSWNTALDAEQLRARTQTRTALAPVMTLYHAEAAHDGADMIFVKENHTARFAGALRRVLPGCRFVYMVRDPRDVAASYLGTNSMPGGVEKAVQVWQQDQADAVALQQDDAIGPDIVFVRYEDLLAQTEPVLRRLTDHLGLPYTPAMLSFHQDRRTQRNAQRIDAWSNLSKPILSQNFGKYRTALTAQEIEYVELMAQDMMHRFDYRPDIVTHAPSPPERAARCAALRPDLRQGAQITHSPDEQAIRQQRLTTIEQIMARRL